MPTIKQLPAATSVNGTDVLPISQGGTTKALTVAQLLSSTQAALLLASGKLLGRSSPSAGSPEPVGVGLGLSLDGNGLAATAADHASLPLASSLGAADEVVGNSGGMPVRMPATALRSLFSAGSGVSISGGTISAVTQPYALPVATRMSLGGVKIDGSSIGIDGAGVISVMPNTSAVPAAGGLLATSGVAGTAQAATAAQFEALMTAWLLGKATTPSATPGWWNNSGNPTYS